MKISSNKVEKAMQVYKKQETKKAINGASRINKKDEFKISEKGKDFQVAKNALIHTPDVRGEKVDNIKGKIQSGTYQVDAGKIVEKMFDRINLDKKV